ncbi:regulatory protein SoxS [Defluviimonas sp. 20V17]|nr:regulatory protein SoxS [Defluviimonas sp. 20V17]
MVMFEQQGCPYCAAWNRDVGPTYSKTKEGQAAPLYRRDIHDPIPSGMKLTSPPQFTPTFVLLEDGTEVGRIQGYPGADFFWALLDGLLKKTKAAPPKA